MALCGSRALSKAGTVLASRVAKRFCRACPSKDANLSFLQTVANGRLDSIRHAAHTALLADKANALAPQLGIMLACGQVGFIGHSHGGEWLVIDQLTMEMARTISIWNRVRLMC